ncbi:4Fe-4S binding protein [bacterium]|nr:4Fe-4S binding protein [bacterium]
MIKYREAGPGGGTSGAEVLPTVEQTHNTAEGTILVNGHNGNGAGLRSGKVSSAKPKKAKLVKWDKKKFALKVRLTRTSGWRLIVQTAFLATCLYLGYLFLVFVEAAKTTTNGPLPLRPPGVEGFLPISGLMGLIDWVNQGALNTIHPAATILFILFVVLSLVLRKSFCGWICPVGFFSENLARLGRVLFKRNFLLPTWLDVLLRSIKYLILGFFGWAIFNMTPSALDAFIQSPYNKVSDVKMLDFFLQLSGVGLIVIAVLAIGSVFINGFWCRYMCPYGALMGIASWLSPVKVRRDPVSCTDCGLCDKACPARLPVMTSLKVTSPECIGCNDCVTSCPVPTALWMGTPKRKLAPKRIAIVIGLVFILGVIGARFGGWWYNDIPDDEIRMHVEKMHSDEYGHPGR